MSHPMSDDEVEAVALLISAGIMKRYAAALREDGASDQGAVDALAMLVGAVAIPVLKTFLAEEHPLQALDEQDALERLLAE